MRIWGDIPKVPGLYGKNKNINKMDKACKAISQKDEISISEKARDYQVVLKALKDVPDIRKDKVEKLSKHYASGTYNPKGSEVAEKMIKSIIDKKV